MRIAIRSTHERESYAGSDCQVWTGRTYNGVKCRVLVRAVFALEGEDMAALARDTQGIDGPDVVDFEATDLLHGRYEN